MPTLGYSSSTCCVSALSPCGGTRTCEAAGRLGPWSLWSQRTPLGAQKPSSDLKPLREGAAVSSPEPGSLSWSGSAVRAIHQRRGATAGGSPAGGGRGTEPQRTRLASVAAVACPPTDQVSYREGTALDPCASALAGPLSSDPSVWERRVGEATLEASGTH